VAAVAAATLVAVLEDAADEAVVAAWADVTALPAVAGAAVLAAAVADVLPAGEGVAVVPPQAVRIPTPTAAKPAIRASICRRPIAGAE